MRLKGEGEYFRGILVFLLFSGLLEMSEKVTVCLATHFSFHLFFFFFCIDLCHTRKPTPPSCNYPSCSSRIVMAAVKSMKTLTLVIFQHTLFPAATEAILVLHLK